MQRVLKQVWFRSFLLLALLLAAAQSTLATTIVRPSDDDLIVGARAIVRGKVVKIESALDTNQNRIFSYITIKVKEVLKGQITERRIVLKELGGQVGDRIDVTYGNPEFKRGESILVYLDTWADGSLRTYQMLLGKFSIVKDEVSGHEFVVRDLDAENVVVLNSHDGHAHGASTDRMEMGAYRTMVLRHLETNLERSARFDQSYYPGVPILARPTDFASVSGRSHIRPQFTLISPTNPARWYEPDTNLPVIYRVNPDGAPSANTINDFAAAAAAWSNKPGSALVMSYGGDMSSCYLGGTVGGIHVVFNNCDGRNAPSPGCASILAWGGYSGTRFQPKVVSGTTFNFAITQGFVSFNPYAACHFGDSCQVQEIATHELGHALALGHSQDSSATMAAFAHFDGRCASIRADDLAGIVFIYPGSGGGGGPLSITTSSLAGGTTGSSYSQTLAASGGTAPYGWSLVAGLGTLPAGLTLNSNGTITGTPTTAGSSSFTVRVTDSQSATAQRAFTINVVQAGAGYDAQFLSQSVPTTLSPGQAFQATVNWLNTGTQTWQGSSGLRLLSQNPLNNVFWGGNTVLLSFFTVAPGQQLNLTFQATAPTTPGTYNFQWQVARDAVSTFGQMSANVAIQVGDGGGGGGSTNDAQFLSQSVPTTMTAGQVVPVSLTMRNSGTTTWAAGTYFLRSLNPAGNSTWGLSQVGLTSSVAPGASVTFSFNATAPAVAGGYNFQWQMFQSGVGNFGGASTNVAVNVTSSGGGATNNASFVSQTVGSSMTVGQTASVTVTMRNTGTTTWAAGSYYLRSQNPVDNMTWGVNRVNLASPVTPGNNATFTFNMTAPATAGLYNFQWRMSQDGVGSFGDTGLNAGVNVTSGSVAPLAITTTSIPHGNRFVAYSAQINATGGEAPYTWSVSGGTLAPGLTLNSSTGVISGAPTTLGTYTFTVTVRDQGGRSTSRSYKFAIR
jgi:hypothetical protein